MTVRVEPYPSPRAHRVTFILGGRRAWVMRHAAWPALLAMLVVLATPTAIAAEQARALDEDVWVGWSAAVDAVDRADLESIDFQIEAGREAAWALALNNTGATTIRNVTLVLVRDAGLERYSFGRTYAGDPPLEDYGYWKEIPSGYAKLVPLVARAASTPQPFAMEFLVFHEREGIPMLARTTVHGAVVGGDESSALLPGVAPVAWALAAVGVALVLRRARR